MDLETAVTALSALAHETRLAVFRMLIEVGPNGMQAGDIAVEVGVSPSALTFHLKQLEYAGLIRSRRDARFVIYAADVEGTRRLMDYLTAECCGGRPELCGGLTAPLVCR